LGSFSLPCPLGLMTTSLTTCLYNQGISRIYTLQPQRWRQHVPLKHQSPPTRLHIVTSQKTRVWTTTSTTNTTMKVLKVIRYFLILCWVGFFLRF
jgi:hypothetical protein